MMENNKINLMINKLRKIRDSGKNEFWNIGDKTAEYMKNIILKNRLKSILEIGTSNGLSTLYLYEAVKQNDGTLTTIESNTKRFDIALKNFQEAGILKDINFIKGHSPEILKYIDDKFDFVFIDCVKEDYLKTYIELKKKLVNNWIIVCDNIISHKDELQNFLQYIKNENIISFEIIEIENGLMTLKPDSTVCV